MILNLNKELVSKALLYFGGVVLTVSIGRCAYNYYNYKKNKELIKQIEEKINQNDNKKNEE
jgi:hypothetical protein